MSSTSHKILEYTFFLIVLATSGYLVWKLFSPFVGAIALAAIITTICYPMYERIVRRMPRQNKTLGALASIGVVLLVIVAPLVIIASLILREALSIYALFNSSNQVDFINTVSQFESIVQRLIPSFSVDMASVVQQTASFVVEHLISIFAGTASTLFLFFIAMIASYYFFKDGKQFTRHIVQLSPLKDVDDAHIISRLAIAIRSVALGTVSVAIIQGILTAIGLSIFGFDRAILWGCVAAIGALVPGVGTTIVLVPAVGYLLYMGSHVSALLLGLWAALAVGLVDNMIGPYMMSRGNNLHPFLILLSVLGGISLFGPIGFILGPVIVSLFLVLLELYHTHVKETT